MVTLTTLIIILANFFQIAPVEKRKGPVSEREIREIGDETSRASPEALMHWMGLSGGHCPGSGLGPHGS